MSISISQYLNARLRELGVRNMFGVPENFDDVKPRISTAKPSSGTDTNRKRSLVVALVERLGEAGIKPNDIMVFFLETDRASGSFGGGRFAPPVAFT